jgi:multiple sugar transport system substrate-binding protein
VRALVAAAAVLALAFAVGCGSGEGGAGARTINWYTFDEPSGAYQEGIDNCNRQADGRYEIEIVPLPTDASQQRELLVRRLAAEDDSIDLMSMDVIWTAEFAEAGWIVPVPEDIAREVRGNTLEGPLETATYQDRLQAIPHNSNTQLLWYRTDRVEEPPRTWDEMIEQAVEIGENGSIQVQARQYEGYMVWFNTLVESAGGQILEENGDVALGPPAVEAAGVIERLANSPAAPPALSNSDEDSARLAFQSGDSTFMLNYPFVFPSAKEEAPEVFENMGAALYPRVDPNRPSEVTVGGFNLGVSEFSSKPDLAFEAAMCLRSPENQITNAATGGLPPTIEALYDTPEIREAYPGFADLIEQSLRRGVARPVTPAYSDISVTIQKTLHPPSEIEPQRTIETLRDRLQEVEDGGLF